VTFLANDPFTRTTSPGLGSEPVSGHAYAHLPASTDWSTTGTVARAVSSVVNTLYYAAVDVGSADQVVKVTHTLPVLPAGAAVTLRAAARWKDNQNYYEAQVTIGTGGTANLTIQKRVANVLSTVASGSITGTHVAGNAWTIVLEIFGLTVRAKAWNATTGADPGSWQYSGTILATDPTGTLAAFGHRRETGNTNGTQNIDSDNFSAETLITVIAQNVWPPRVQVAVAYLQVGDSISIYREIGNDRTLVQNGQSVSLTDVSFVRIDAELPFGTPVHYVAVINNDSTTSPDVTYTLPGGKVALSDAISGLSAEVVIWAWPDKAYNPQATVFKPAGRNVVVSGDLGQFTSIVEFYTDATSSAENVKALLDGATQGIILIRQPGGYDDVDCHVAILAYTPRRFSQDGSDPKRIHQVQVAEVTGWAAALAAAGFTYQNLADTYTGLTYANVAADYATYLALAEGDFS